MSDLKSSPLKPLSIPPSPMRGSNIDPGACVRRWESATPAALGPSEAAPWSSSFITMTSTFSLLLSLLLISCGSSAVITGACERDSQCGGAMCCAVSLWIRNLRMCTPMGQEGEECHPLSHKVPFFGKRLHHTCPCLPNLACVRTDDSKSKCLPLYKVQDYYF